MAQQFSLSQTIPLSKQDIRAVCSFSLLGEQVIAAGGRDNVLHLYSRASKTSIFSPKCTYTGHTNFIGAIKFMQPNDQFKFGLLISAGMDKTIQCHEIMEQDPKFILVGHENNVCCLDVSSEDLTIASGSWDNTVIVWKCWEKFAHLKGHSGPVWAVCIFHSSDGEEIVVSGSADKTIKLWKKGECLRTIQAHEDCVRGISKIDDSRFVSCSNDSTLKIWNIHSGQAIFTFAGEHSSFIYSVKYLAKFNLFASSGEDRKLVFWNAKGAVEQTILFPTRTLWCSDEDAETGDVIIGTNDGKVRIFTTDPSRVASDEELNEFQEEVSKFGITRGDMQTENINLQSPSRLKEPGRKSGEHIVIREENGSKNVYQWNGSAWNLIGSVVDDLDQPAKKVTFQGREYDFVFDVEVEGFQAPLKLPYNSGENLFAVATSFANKHNLGVVYVDEIVSFLKKNVPESHQIPKYQAFEEVNVEGASKKIMQSFNSIPDIRAALIEGRFSEIPFEILLSTVENEGYFAVLDVVRAWIVKIDGFFDYLMDNFPFFSQIIFEHEWKGNNLRMIIRFVSNLFCIPAGRKFISLHANQIDDLLARLSVAAGENEKSKEAFLVLQLNYSTFLSQEK